MRPAVPDSAVLDSAGPRLRTRLLSVKHHPSRLIADEDLRRRYQRRRTVIAVIGGLLGGVGVGLSFSHSGVIGASAVAALWLPAVLATVVAVLFVWVPLPELLRWCAVVGILAVSIGLMEVSPTWRIGLAAVGFVLSWVIAAVLQFGIGVAQITVRDVPKALGSVAILAFGLGLFGTALTAADPAAAQVNTPSADAASCPIGRLELLIDGEPALFTTGGTERPVEIELTAGERRTIPVVITSDLDRGTVIVELIDVEPWPLVPPGSVEIWSGDLRPRVGGGSEFTEESALEIDSDGPLGGLQLVIPDAGVDVALVVGQARFRATLNDPESGTECSLDGLLRITAPPLTTIPGIIGVVVAVLGLGLIGGSLLGGSTLLGFGRSRGSDSDDKRPAADDSSPPFSAERCDPRFRCRRNAGSLRRPKLPGLSTNWCCSCS